MLNVYLQFNDKINPLIFFTIDNKYWLWKSHRVDFSLLLFFSSFPPFLFHIPWICCIFIDLLVHLVKYDLLKVTPVFVFADEAELNVVFLWS